MIRSVGEWGGGSHLQVTQFHFFYTVIFCAALPMGCLGWNWTESEVEPDAKKKMQKAQNFQLIYKKYL